uniref:response regulator n=1 Tax=Rhodoferax sp. TaxID=50421 RepID=UPI001B638AB0
MNADGGTLTPIQKILIVDDKPENLTALRNVLSDLSVTCVSAENGNQALAATLHHDFALAILDVQMPGMDGYELATLIRGEPRTRH